MNKKTLAKLLNYPSIWMDEELFSDELFAIQATEFQEEFLNAEKQKHVLEKTPVYVIINYDVSLYGACNAALSLAQTHCQPNDTQRS